MIKTGSILVLFSLVIFGCAQQSKKEEDSLMEQGTEESIESIKEGDVEIITVDGCEYIVFKEAEDTNHGYGYMAHKGNCSNPVHCHNKTKEEKSEKPDL